MANSYELASELLKLIEPAPRRNRLAPAAARPAIVAAIGVGDAAAEAGTGGGIASPLVEVLDTRIFHDHDLTSSDGLFVFENFIPSVMQFTDAEGSAVRIQYDNPYD